jgi:hypothetical protein
MAMKRKKKRRRVVSAPGPGRNLALRPGGGPHTSDEDKRASDKVRREIQEQRDERQEREPPEGSE